VVKMVFGIYSIVVLTIVQEDMNIYFAHRF